MKEDAPRVIKIPAKPEATRQAEARQTAPGGSLLPSLHQRGGSGKQL